MNLTEPKLAHIEESTKFIKVKRVHLESKLNSSGRENLSRETESTVDLPDDRTVRKCPEPGCSETFTRQEETTFSNHLVYQHHYDGRRAVEAVYSR